MKTRDLTCIVCPKGCQITVTFGENGEICEIVGNTCPRGKAYAEKECTHPERTVTTTMRMADGRVVPCKTKDTVPKEKMADVMAEINGATAPVPVAIGEVLIENVAGTGVAVVATANRE